MRKLVTLALILGLLAVLAVPTQAGSFGCHAVGFGRTYGYGVGNVAVFGVQPVYSYSYPAPVVNLPQPVVSAPAPIVAAPAPVVATPVYSAPVVAVPVYSSGFYGASYGFGFRNHNVNRFSLQRAFNAGVKAGKSSK